MKVKVVVHAIIAGAVLAVFPSHPNAHPTAQSPRGGGPGGGAALGAPAVAAQGRQNAAPATAAQLQARHEISVLEGVLENAVRYSAQILNQHLQSAKAPDMVLLTGMARSRGFRLDGYGVVFDVEFPSIRQSVMWGMRALERSDPDLAKAMDAMRKNLQTINDPQARKEMERALSLFEAQVKELDAQAKAAAGASNQGSVSAASTKGSTVSASGLLATDAAPFDPRAIYFSEITNALIAAILDHGAPVGVGAEEWLTVAARESADRRFLPNNPSDTAMTLVLRIKGSDLNALRDRRVSRDEARTRVEVKQY